ncbi:MAG TPA: hypothetical protein VD926_03680, partial [Acidimicrobiales bacterium]|nr:hypothetical protein [Acidimicrobiales bacterium]
MTRRPMMADVRNEKAERVWAELLQLVAEGMSVVKALTVIDGGKGRTVSAYDKKRMRDPEFAARVTAARQGARDAGAPWDGTFADFRKQFFGMDSPPFHLQIVSALEHAKPGRVLLILAPPEHGKSTLLEDFCGYKLAVDPSFRIIVVSEGQPHARKFLRRVKQRMEPDGPAPAYVARWGPFAPQTGTERKMAQPWGADFFDVYKKGEFDERDYSMVSVGIGSAVAGSRTDLLIADDIQSMRNYTQTDKIIETFRQDFLSRPGAMAPTVIIGTRVGEDDVYQRMIDEGIVDDVMTLSAHKPTDHWEVEYGPGASDNPANLPSENVRFLWPERYDRQAYLRMRVKAGPSAWERNYMQRPRRAGESTFTEKMLDECENPTRSILHDPPRDIQRMCVSVDPALGNGWNATMVTGWTAEKMYLLTWRLDQGLTNYQQAFQIIDGMCDRYKPIHELVIEQNNYQKGLVDDDALHDLVKRYGFRVTGHQTGRNKYDPDLGIAQMAHSFLRGEIDIPSAQDDATRGALNELREQLLAWRPFKKGAHLKQDLVVVLWFAWI